MYHLFQVTDDDASLKGNVGPDYIWLSRHPNIDFAVLKQTAVEKIDSR